MVLFTKQNETENNLVQDREQTPDNVLTGAPLHWPIIMGSRGTMSPCHPLQPKFFDIFPKKTEL